MIMIASNLNEINETYFSVLQDILLDRHGEEILATADENVVSNNVSSLDGKCMFNTTVYTWILAIIGSALVGLSGLLPVFFTPEYAIQDEQCQNSSDSKQSSCSICGNEKEIQNPDTSRAQSGNNNVDHCSSSQPNLISESKPFNTNLKLMLSFAVGGLLGDVFLHLLPEAHQKLYLKAVESKDPFQYIHDGHFVIGIWILIGILTFIFVEMIFNIKKNIEDKEQNKGIENHPNNAISVPTSDKEFIQSPVISKEDTPESKSGQINISGYLNLMANCIDNFSHGLAVGGAFLIGPKVGITTTICILFHEIPHEIGDFAILIKSGFNRYDAALAQLSTASIGICGALLALALDTFVTGDGGENLEIYTSWIIPFTCGGFINISLVTVLPDIMESHNLTDCLKTLAAIGFGVVSMALISNL